MHARWSDLVGPFRRMIDLLHNKAFGTDNSIDKLNEAFRVDLAWWGEFLTQWNGISFLPQPLHRNRLTMTSDASGTWGCWYKTSWFQIQSDATAQPPNDR